MKPSSPFTRSEWVIVLILAAINFTHILDFVIVMPLGNKLMKEFTISEAQFARIVSVYGIAAAIAGLCVALIADRFDRKKLLLTFFFAFIIATFFCGIAKNYYEMILARTFAGGFGGVVASLLLAVIGDTFANERRGQATGFVMAAFAIASIAGLPAGLALANQFGRGMPFYAIAGLSIPILIWAYWSLPAYDQHLQKANAENSGWRNAFKSLIQAALHPEHIRAFAFMFFLVLGTFTIIPFIAPYLEKNCGRFEGDIPKIYSIAGSCTLFSMILIGRLTDKIGQRVVFCAIAFGSLIMTIVITQLGEINFTTAVIVTTLFMMTASGRMVPAQALMLKNIQPHMRGAFTSLNSAVSHAGTGIAPFIAGLILSRDAGNRIIGYQNAGYTATGFAILALCLSIYVGRGQKSA